MHYIYIYVYYVLYIYMYIMYYIYIYNFDWTKHIFGFGGVATCWVNRRGLPKQTRFLSSWPLGGGWGGGGGSNKVQAACVPWNSLSNIGIGVLQSCGTRSIAPNIRTIHRNSTWLRRKSNYALTQLYFSFQQISSSKILLIFPRDPAKKSISQNMNLVQTIIPYHANILQMLMWNQWKTLKIPWNFLLLNGCGWTYMILTYVTLLQTHSDSRQTPPANPTCCNHQNHVSNLSSNRQLSAFFACASGGNGDEVGRFISWGDGWLLTSPCELVEKNWTDTKRAWHVMTTSGENDNLHIFDVVST